MVARRSDQNKLSRYVQGGISVSLPTRIGWWDRRVLAQGIDDIFITITARYDKRPDLVAYDVYGKATYMWLVLQYNTIVDINLEFVEGKQIRLPPMRRVQAELVNAPKV